MDFAFVESVDQHLFDRTRGAWDAQLKANPENTSEPLYAANLAYVERVIKGEVLTADGGGCVCAVMENGNEFASALIVVSHAKAKSDNPHLKMLNLYVQPDLNLADSEPNYVELAWIASTAIIGCIGLTYEAYPSKELKIYSAFPLDREFLTRLSTAMMTDRNLSENFEVSMHGNWLVVSKKA